MNQAIKAKSYHLKPKSYHLSAKSYQLKAAQGFTLVEILIVVSIIGLLASIVLVGLGSFRSRGRDARRIADLGQTQNALELYYSKFGSYPMVAADQLERTLVDAEIGVTGISDDPSAPSRHYGYGSNGGNYVLGAHLEDKNGQVLRDDVDGSGGETFGVECGTPTGDEYYCIRL